MLTRISFCRVLVLGALLPGVYTSVANASAAPTHCGARPETAPNEYSALDIADSQIAAAVAQVDALAQKLMQTSGIPGMAVAVVRDGKNVFARGYGVRSVSTGLPVDADTVFQLASMSKSIGATVISRQVGNRVLAWDTRMQTLMPQFKLGDPYVSSNLTVADLYAHRSGLPEHVGDFMEDLGFDRPQILHRLRYAPLAPFRNRYAYTNFGMTAAAEAVAVASHSDWATLSQQALYAPLGMNSTSSRHADFLARTNRTAGHVRQGDRFVVAPSQRDPDAQSPAGGVSSSVNDIARWMTMLLSQGCVNGERLIADTALLAATSPQVVSAAPATPRARAGFYGYGFNVGQSASGRVTLTHSGAFALGASTAFTVIPSAGVGIVTLTNAVPTGVPETLNATFADLVQFGRVTQPWEKMYAAAFAQILAPSGEHACKPGPNGEFDCPKPPTSATRARPLASYAGEYRSNFYGRALVSVDRDALSLRLGPKAMTFRLSHWDGSKFLMVPPGESAMPGSRSIVAFAVGTMTIEYLNQAEQAGLGRFRRLQLSR